MTARINCLLVACAASSCTLALAQEQPRAVGVTLEEIVVTTTRRAESAQDIPLSISAISGEQLAHLGVTQTRDLAALTPNLATQGSFGRTSPAFFIRGVGSTQFNPNANSKVGIYVDDVYLNSPAVHGAQLFDIDRIEIARGPQGYLFGQNTTAGLVRAITRRPEIGGGMNGDFQATYGRFNQVDLDAALGFDIGQNAAGRVAVISERRDGISDNTLSGRKVGETDALAWRTQLLMQPADSLTLLVNAHGSRDDSELTPYKQIGLVDPASGAACPQPGLGSGCTDFFGYADSTDFHSGQWDVPRQLSSVDAVGGSVTLEWEAASFTVTAVSSYEKNDLRINEDTDSGPFDVVHGSYDAQPEQFSQEIRLTSPASGRVRWIGGLYYFDEDFEGGTHFATRGFGPGFFTGVSDVPEGVGQRSSMQTRSVAAFGTLDIQTSERGKLSLGLRYTQEQKELSYDAYLTDTSTVEPGTLVEHDDLPALALFQTISFPAREDWDNISGRLSFDYRFTDDVMGYASFARGFNSGNFNGGAFFDPAEASLVDPEILKSYEIGLKSQLAGGALRLNASAYYYDFTDQQVFILASTDSGAPFQQLANAATSSLYGAELELAWQPVAALLVQAGAGYTHSRFDEFNSPVGGDLSGNELPSAPDFNFNALIQYSWPMFGGTFALEADSKYTGDQFFSVNNDPLLTQDAYWLTNARASFSTADERVTVAVWGRNIADERYLAGAYDLAAFGFDQWVVAEPRTYGVSLQYRFH